MKHDDPTNDKDTELEPADETSNRIVLGCLCALIVFAVIGVFACIAGALEILHPHP
jgi:hypothetical protein